MKSYFPLRMLALPVFLLCLITTSCKKEDCTCQNPPRTVVLQADPKSPAGDHVEMSLGNFNGSDYSLYPTLELNANAWTINGDPVVMRSVFKFNGLAAACGQRRPKEAYLTLSSSPTPGNGDLVNANAGPDNSIYIRRVTGNWVPTSTNWFSQPATTTQGQISIPHTDSPFLDLIDIDVTQMVSDMLASGNYGFMIQLQNESYYNSRMFCSSNHADFAKRPKLTLIF